MYSRNTYGSWFTIHGSRFVVHGSRFVVHDSRCKIHDDWIRRLLKEFGFLPGSFFVPKIAAKQRNYTDVM